MTLSIKSQTRKRPELEKAKHSLESKTARIQVLLTPELLRKFKLKALTQDVTMSDVLIKAIKLYLKDAL